MPHWRVGHHDDWPTLGWEVIDWIEAYLCHGPGDVQGQPIELDDEEVQLVLDLYRLHPKGHEREGRRVVNRGRYSRPKGRAKSEIAGMLVCAELRGEVRFDGWKANGDPQGRPVTYPFVRCLATEEGQAGNTYDNVRVMLEHAIDTAPDVFGGIDVGLTRIFMPDKGECRPSTAASASKDGGKETFVVPDEVHLYHLPDLKAMHRTVGRNLNKRPMAEPWMFETSTMHRPGQGSIGESGFELAESIRAGKRKAHGFYMNHREGLPVKDWSSDAEILAALPEGYGEAAYRMDFNRVLHDDIRDPEATEADSRRYFLNQHHVAADSAFDVDVWKALTSDYRIAPGSFVAAGFDGAQVDDSTAIVITEIDTGHQELFALWERPPDVETWSIDVELVNQAVDDLFERFDVWRLYADPPYWQTELAAWQGRHGDKRVIEWWTNAKKAMAYAIQNWANAMKPGALSHDGNVDLSRHIGNAKRAETRIRDESSGRFLWVMRKEAQKSPRKIDAAMAACLSWEARTDALAAGAKQQKQYRAAGF